VLLRSRVVVLRERVDLPAELLAELPPELREELLDELLEELPAELREEPPPELLEELFLVAPNAGATAVSKESASKADGKILMHR
jgi:hypothetical protein